MEVFPPDLFSSHDLGDTGVTVTADVDAGIVELAVRGRWSQHLSTRVYTVIRKCLTEHPAAIVIDLHRLDDVSGASAVMWMTANRACLQLEPPVRLVVCVPPTTTVFSALRRLGAVRFMSVFAGVPEARLAIANKVVLTDRMQLPRLAPEPLAVRTARNLVDRACEAWHMPHLLQRGRLIVSELATNVVEHARTDMTVTAWRRGRGLHLSVRDGDVRPPRLRPVVPADTEEYLEVGGRGLQLVAAASTAWGMTPTANGKVVWATLRVAQQG
jgi:anti-sigma regulatory factor (Ser/Thr protein kinase)